MKVLVTGAAGIAGRAVCQALAGHGYDLRRSDVVSAAESGAPGEFIRCDTRSPRDVDAAVGGVDAVVHLAAWHCAHRPPVSDDTIFAVNVDGTYNVFEACRRAGVRRIIYASSMAYGWNSVYSLTKVIGEEMCRAYHEMTGAAIAMLRYHCFVPCSYLEFGARLLRNGIDHRDVAGATLAALRAMQADKIGLWRTVVHTNHGMPPEVIEDFRALGPDWCESKVAGAKELIRRYELPLPERVEQHDLSGAEALLGWRAEVDFITFLRDLERRDRQRLPIRDLWCEGGLPD